MPPGGRLLLVLADVTTDSIFTAAATLPHLELWSLEFPRTSLLNVYTIGITEITFMIYLVSQAYQIHSTVRKNEHKI